jgi:hypothetical protein
MFFDGSNQEFLVYYNSKPEDNNISAKIFEPCQQGEQALTPGRFSAAPHAANELWPYPTPAYAPYTDAP